jgi:hypothetical protein
MSGMLGLPNSASLTTRARRCRSLAQGITNTVMRDQMLELADNFEILAKSVRGFEDQIVKVQEHDD